MDVQHTILKVITYPDCVNKFRRTSFKWQGPGNMEVKSQAVLKYKIECMILILYQEPFHGKEIVKVTALSGYPGNGMTNIVFLIYRYLYGKLDKVFIDL